MSKQQFDLFEQPPPSLARGHSAEEVSTTPFRPKEGTEHYHAAQELIHFTDWLKLNDWQQKYLWPHLKDLLEKMRVAEQEHVKWFELGYIISAMEIEQIRSRSAALEICKKHGVQYV